MSWREALEDSAAIQFLNDMGGRIRYGVPTAEKEAMAVRGEVPGHDKANMKTGVGQDIEQRRAAAYLFGRNYPQLAPEWQPLISRFMRSGDDPRVLAVAQTAVEQGAADAKRAQAEASRALLARFKGGSLGAILGMGTR